jgi:hypothetical protein
MTKAKKLNLSKLKPLKPQPKFDKNGWLDKEYWNQMFEYIKERNE